MREGFMRRAERLFHIVQILRRGRGPVTARQIGEELEVSARSVYRDIAALIGQRVPIRGEAGVGYVLEAGFDMPPLMLTADELDAAVLGASWVATRGEPQIARAARDLLTKLEAVVPEHLRFHVTEPSTSVAPVVASEEAVSSALLRDTIRTRQKLAIGYSDSRGCYSERVVWPVILGYRDVGRILAAWCETKQGFRYFRTERMKWAKALADRVPEPLGRLRKRWRAAMDEERLSYSQQPAEQTKMRGADCD